MNKFIFIILIVFCVDINSTEYFNDKARGITSGDFLNLDINPRVLALGGVQGSVVDDASSISLNPAGLMEINNFSIFLSRSKYIEGINYNFMSYAQRITYDGVVGISAFTNDIGTIEHTDIDQNILGRFSPSDVVVGISYSRGITEFSDRETDVTMGIGYKYIRSKIYNTAKATAVDLGINVYKFTYIPYKLSFVINNLGSGLRYDQESVPIPMKFRIGTAIYPFPSLLCAVDFVWPKNDIYYLNVGSELNLKTAENFFFSLRGGFNTLKTRNDLGGFSFGFGILIKFLSVDYGFTSMGELGNTHLISISFDFPLKEPVFERKEKSVYRKYRDIK
ncbi:MAG: PorV/PorQ family protein [Elusimicrobiales bacterium]|nr:PorV/PorQ family protein [Elusimicrobiales bacterium]